KGNVAKKRVFLIPFGVIINVSNGCVRKQNGGISFFHLFTKFPIRPQILTGYVKMVGHTPYKYIFSLLKAGLEGLWLIVPFARTKGFIPKFGEIHRHGGHPLQSIIYMKKTLAAHQHGAARGANGPMVPSHNVVICKSD